jgi:hypothetical protein
MSPEQKHLFRTMGVALIVGVLAGIPWLSGITIPLGLRITMTAVVALGQIMYILGDYER